MIRFRFVDDMRKTYPVKRLCEVLKINRSSYYKWKKTAPTRNNRLISDAILGAKIKSIFANERGCYGAKRITAELNDNLNTTTPVNHKRVARVMSSMKLYGFTKKRKVITTIPAAVKPVFPDLVKRHFNAVAANEVYVGDITYLPIADGSNMYLATVIDCYSRRLVGFAIADHMRTSLVQDALLMAKGQRGSLKGAVFHSDHGSVGGFKWSSQHLDRGGVQRWQRRTGAGRLVMFRRGCVGSGVRIGRCGPRCGRPAVRNPRGRCSVSSGA